MDTASELMWRQKIAEDEIDISREEYEDIQAEMMADMLKLDEVLFGGKRPNNWRRVRIRVLFHRRHSRRSRRNERGRR